MSLWFYTHFQNQQILFAEVPTHRTACHLTHTHTLSQPHEHTYAQAHTTTGLHTGFFLGGGGGGTVKSVCHGTSFWGVWSIILLRAQHLHLRRYSLVHMVGPKVYLTSPGPSELGHNSFISQPILKLLRPVDSSLASESSDYVIKPESLPVKR